MTTNCFTNDGYEFNEVLLTDYYQLTMCYAYWKSKIHNEKAVFDVFFRKNPFSGEYTIFAGLEDVIKFVKNFKLKKSDLEYIKLQFPQNTESEFFEYLEKLDCSNITISAIPEGTVVFPKIPLITIEGPLAICQLLETSILNQVNFASLVTTNAVRFRLAAGDNVQLLELGLRRAQGPNGALSASKYCYIGGFDGTSNVLAGKLFGIPVRGTQAHSFICSFGKDSNLKGMKLNVNSTHEEFDLLENSKNVLNLLFEKINFNVDINELNKGELVAFCAYATTFPDSFLALIDTYDVLNSGVINFIAVTIALFDAGYQSVGCRIDSGDLCYLSIEIRKYFNEIARVLPKYNECMNKLIIIASNGINENTLQSFNEQENEIDAFGVGTNLVTCEKQPALGCVYKLVSLSGIPKIKLSQEMEKMTLPGKKSSYRIYGKGENPIVDFLCLDNEPEPKVGKEILCRHPFIESKRAFVTPIKVEKLQKVYWKNGKICQKMPSLVEIKKYVSENIKLTRKDHKRFFDPTPYKVSISKQLYEFLHTLWLENTPVRKLE
ncbi:Nicotinate phosphoribosyltransferase [Strongyloides ratti]|uniref:Nicotinate phosphoribosyltransferase n=1 Tax=Strongyloides ratti TaxID=34506 RepID=A0A090LFG7_STRRB|nr:Nicotinate phosphoribosyltransferase [Strongyloides ratti]CEF66205.1 Nicotinate phosphoribosyltransferase [Strongyloides ratti]